MESQYIREAKKQKPRAQTALYELYKRYWFAICLRYQGSRQDAEDCLQNSLIKIFSNIKQFDSAKGEFKSWSAQIIVNENLMFLRSAQRTEELNETNHNIFSDELAEEEGIGISAEQLTRLMQKLPVGYRTVFNLYVMEGYTHKEIGEILNISSGSSKSQLAKARRMLRRHMEVLV